MKRIIKTLIAVNILAGVLMLAAAGMVGKSEEYYVADHARVLTETTRQDIIEANVDLEARCNGAQIVIVTTEYSEGMYADEYATRLFNDWGVGNAQENNGMLLLLITEEYKGWLVTGAGISGAFTESMAEKYLDEYFWDYVDKREYDTAVRSICEELFTWYAGYYGVTQGNQGGTEQPVIPDYPQESQYYQPQPEYRATNFSFSGIVSMLFIIVVVFVILIIIGSLSVDRQRHRTYYVQRGVPVPTYHWWYMLGRTHRHNTRRYNAPRGSAGWFGGGRGRPPGGFGRPPVGKPGGTTGRTSGAGRSGRSSGSGFGGFGSGRSSSSRGGGGFGGFGGGSSGGSRGGGGFGGFGGGSGGGFKGGGSGGGGFSGGGGGGRR